MNRHPKITEPQEQQVVAATADYIRHASSLLGHQFEIIPVLFDLRGRIAGMYRVRGDERVIRFNPWIFAKYFDENLANTVPHEVAHYIIDIVYGVTRKKSPVKPHGAEWRQLMEIFGADPSRTCDFDLSGLPQRRQRRYAYACACSSHEISATRHNRIRRGTASYKCMKCGSELQHVTPFE